MLKFKYSLIGGLITGLVVGIYGYVIGNLGIALVVGCFAGFWMLIGFYFKILARTDSKKFVYTAPVLKQAIHKGRANHLAAVKRRESAWIGGTLYLLSDCLVFQTNFINVGFRHEKIVPLKEIIRAEIGDENLYSSEISIKTEHGNVRFLVNDAQVWEEHINKQRPKLHS